MVAGYVISDIANKFDKFKSLYTLFTDKNNTTFALIKDSNSFLYEKEEFGYPRLILDNYTIDYSKLSDKPEYIYKTYFALRNDNYLDKVVCSGVYDGNDLKFIGTINGKNVEISYYFTNHKIESILIDNNDYSFLSEHKLTPSAVESSIEEKYRNDMALENDKSTKELNEMFNIN